MYHFFQSVAEINRGSQIFRMLPWPMPSPILALNVVFFGKLVPNPICVPHLKLLASTVAEIKNRGPHFFGCSPSLAPSNFDPKRIVFGKQHPVPKWCKNFVAQFGNLRANGVKGSKFLVENVIFGIADPDLPIHYATFMGLRR